VKKIALLLSLLLIFAPTVNAAVLHTYPEIPSNGIDDDHNGTIDEAVNDVWTAVDADYKIEAEDCQILAPIAEVADDAASGSAYVQMAVGNSASDSQIRCQHAFTADDYYIWALVRNFPGSRRLWWSTSSIPRRGVNGTLAMVLPELANYTWIPLGTTGSNLNFKNGTNETAQRSVTDPGAIYIMLEPGIQLDALVLSPNISTDAGAIFTAGPTQIAYEIRDIGDGNSMPTADGTIDAIWANVPAVSYAGWNQGVTGSPSTKLVWDKDSTPKRLCALHTYTLANLVGGVTTDDTDLSGDTALYLYWKITNLTRTRDADSYLMGVNMDATQAVIDANWPDGNFSTTVDLANLSHGRSYSGNVVVIEVCFDIPGSPVADQQILLNVRANERVTGTGAGHWGAFNQSPTQTYQIDGWGVAKLSSTGVAASADETAPVLTSCSAVNVGNANFDAQCTTDEGGTAWVEYDTDDDGAVSGGDFVVGQSTPVGTGVITLNVPSLTQGTAYEWRMRIQDAAGNTGDGAVVDTTTTSETQRFVSVSGTGTEAGTNCADTNDTTRCPLSQIAVRASPGETWIIKDGTYATTSTGRININGAATGTGAANGTVTQPVTVRAENERQAWIQSNGAVIPFEMKNCSYWRVEGLRLSQADLASPTHTGNNVLLWNVHNFVFRRNLLQFNNRYAGGASFAVEIAMTNSLIEENELYDYHRNGMAISLSSNNNVIRRNYINSRSRADITGGYVSGDKTRGDTGFACYPCHTNIFENNIVENVGAGVDVLAQNPGSNDNLILGNVTLDSWRGTVITARGSTDVTMPHRNHFRDFVAIGNDEYGWSSASAKESRCDNCTLINNGGGFRAVRDPNLPGDGTYSVFGDNVLSYNNNTNSNINAGLIIDTSVGSWTFLIDYMNSFGHGTNFNPAATNPSITNELSIDPQIGSCKLWLPDASPMKGAGKGGADIGANILYAYENGVLTSNKLFDTGTNKWQSQYMGAIVEGVNSDPANSLTGVFARLNVGAANGCAFPAGY
jgi:hypothetical protein